MLARPRTTTAVPAFTPPNDAADRTPGTGSRGFTLIELLVVMAIVAILALIAVPGIPDRVVRDQIVDSVKAVEFVKAPIAAAWATTARMPVNNAEAGLPSSDRIVSSYVSNVAVESGAIQITFGNQANANLRGKTLTLRPGVVEDAPIVPVAWVCGLAAPPVPMAARGLDKTNVPVRYLPFNCLAPTRPTSVG